MSRNLVLNTALILTLVSPLIFAQERPRAEEILRWFPYGDYQTTRHLDLESMKEFGYLEAFRKVCLRKMGTREKTPLPELFYESIISYTDATILGPAKEEPTIEENRDLAAKQLERDEKTADGEDKTEHANVIRPANIRNNKPASNSKRCRLWVFRFFSLDTIIETAEKECIIEKTGELIDSRPVYKFHSLEYSAVLFIYPTATQELLAAETNEHLKLMHLTGLGLNSNILSHRSYADLAYLVSEFGQYWSFFSYRQENQRKIEAMRNAGASRDEIANAEESMIKGTQYSFTTIILGEENKKVVMTVFGDVDNARSCEALISGKPTITESYNFLDFLLDYVDYLQRKREDQTVERDGNTVIRTTIYDKKLIDSYRTNATTEATKN